MKTIIQAFVVWYAIGLIAMGLTVSIRRMPTDMVREFTIGARLACVMVVGLFGPLAIGFLATAIKER